VVNGGLDSLPAGAVAVPSPNLNSSFAVMVDPAGRVSASTKRGKNRFSDEISNPIKPSYG
jgi:hypothetical protein